MTSTTPEAGQERAADYAARHFRWNASFLVAEAVAFFAGLAFFDSTTVMPVLLRQLHASDRLIGFTRFLGIVGFTLPALFSAHYVHGRRSHKSFLLATCAIGRAGLVTIPFALLLYGRSRPSVALAWILCVVSVFWVLDGACSVSWFDIVAKTIPARVRGRFFGAMQTMGGLAATLSGLVVAGVLESRGLRFPTNFALLAGLWCAGAAVSLVGLCFIREPYGAVDDEEKPTLGQFVRASPGLLRRSPRLAQLIVIRVLLDGTGVAAPFYVLFARDDLNVPLQTVGIYAVVQNAGRLVTGPLWGWITDRFGPPVGLRAVATAVLCVPLLALAASGGATWLFPAVFLLLGGVMDGTWMVASSVLLESVTPQDRPTAVGVATVFQTPSALYGLAGGFLAQYTSYPVVFGVAAGFGAAGLGMAFRLRRVARTDGEAGHR